MKKTKKLISMLLSLCLVVSALSVSAAAADYDDDSFYSVHVMSEEEVLALLASTPSVCDLSDPIMTSIHRTNANGTNGVVLRSFIAEGSTYMFRIVSADGATTYNVGLYSLDPLTGLELECAKPVLDCPINRPTYFSNLQIGQIYYFKLSSYTLPSLFGTAYYQYGTI